MTSDARTRAYTGGEVADTSVGVVIGESIATPAGQMALLALCNAIARNHPVVYVDAPDVAALAGPDLSTHAAIARLSSATDTSRIEIGPVRPRVADVVLGVGADAAGADLYIGADRFTGSLAPRPLPVTHDQSSSWGAGLASMLAANAVFRRALGLPVPDLGALSLWDLTGLDRFRSSGPADIGPIDIGTAWLVGAGGVGSSLAWWLAMLGGATGSWTVIDHDLVDITNLNRSLGMFLADWNPGAVPAFKADVAAALIGAASITKTWADWVSSDPAPPDVLIPAANDFGVRAAMAAYSHPMALTGTTSRNWTSELHVYRAGVDGCINCRHPAAHAASFACSSVDVSTETGEHKDAALSFLSGSAGLMAAAALARLSAGESGGATNHWQLAFAGTRRPITPNRHRCANGTPHALPSGIRSELFGATRWA